MFVTGLTWTAYLIGVVYHQTWLESAGIDSYLYPQEAAQYFIFAFYAVVSSLAAILPPILSDFAIPAAILLIWILITLAANLSNMFERHRWVALFRFKISESRRFRQLSMSIIIPVLGSLVTIYIPIMTAFILILPVVFGQTAGKREAKRYLKIIDQGCDVLIKSESPCTRITKAGEPVAIGIVVAASDKYVAIIEKGRGRSILLEEKELTRQRQTVEH